MTASSVGTIPFMIIFIILFFYIAIPTLLLSLLQLFLCRKELKWGRILPIFSAVVSVLVSLFVLIFCVNAVGINGIRWMSLSTALAALLIFNIPTLVFCLIYRSAKKKRDQEDLDRMMIDDLE